VPSVTRPDGTKLHYEVAGDPRRPALVLLEGMGGDIPGWRRNIPHLARETFVVAYDHRGNGLSDGPDHPTTMATYVEDCLALIDELAITRAHVYGQSFGGMVALELALAFPEHALGDPRVYARGVEARGAIERPRTEEPTVAPAVLAGVRASPSRAC
jgi:pimeloyl-ACP methyl ester carboxylesterase